MERRRADAPEWPLQTQLAMIRDAGFDGAGVRFIDPAFATEVTSFLRAHKMIWQAQCYPKNVDDLKPVLELVARLGADHVNLQPTVPAQGGGMHPLARGLAASRRSSCHRRACRDASRSHDDGFVLHATATGLLSGSAAD